MLFSFSNTLRDQIFWSDVRTGITLSKCDNNDNGRLTFKPYDAVVPNRDSSAEEYPVRFEGMANSNGGVWYTVAVGSCNTGLGFVPLRY